MFVDVLPKFIENAIIYIKNEILDENVWKFIC